MRLSIAEILKLAGDAKGQDEKANVLIQNASEPLKTILRLTYNPNTEWLVPESEPPYTPSEGHDGHGMLYAEARRLRIFYKGGGYDNLNQLRRETLFVELLETLHKSDALVIVDMLTKKKFKGINEKVVKQAFPGLF